MPYFPIFSPDFKSMIFVIITVKSDFEKIQGSTQWVSCLLDIMKISLLLLSSKKAFFSYFLINWIYSITSSVRRGSYRNIWKANDIKWLNGLL